MAQINIQVQSNGIHAEIEGGNKTILENSSVKLDVLTLSYSTLGILCDYNIDIENIVGLTEYNILHNGKNSRFSSEGIGSCDIKLTVFDDAGNFNSSIITLTII